MASQNSIIARMGDDIEDIIKGFIKDKGLVDSNKKITEYLENNGY